MLLPANIDDDMMGSFLRPRLHRYSSHDFFLLFFGKASLSITSFRPHPRLLFMSCWTSTASYIWRSLIASWFMWGLLMILVCLFLHPIRMGYGLNDIVYSKDLSGSILDEASIINAFDLFFLEKGLLAKFVDEIYLYFQVYWLDVTQFLSYHWRSNHRRRRQNKKTIN